MRSTLNDSLSGLESSLSALNENVDMDELVEEAPLYNSFEKLLKRVNSEIDVLRNQLRSASDLGRTERLISSIIEELVDLQSDLELMKPRIIQVLDIQKQSMLTMASDINSLRDLLDGLPEDVLIQHISENKRLR